MALTPSTMLALGTPLPSFDLPQVSGSRLNQRSLDQRPVLLMVLCAHCPFVKHVEPELTRLEHDFGDRVQLIGVSSNSLITHPQDGPNSSRSRPGAMAGVFPTCWMSNKPWPERSGPPAPGVLSASRDSEGLQTLPIAASWTAADPAMINPLMAGTCGRPSRLCCPIPGEPRPDRLVGCNVKWNPDTNRSGSAEPLKLSFMQVLQLSQQIDDLGKDLEEAVLEVLRSGQYIGGPQIKRFEEAFAASIGCEMPWAATAAPMHWSSPCAPSASGQAMR